MILKPPITYRASRVMAGEITDKTNQAAVFSTLSVGSQSFTRTLAPHDHLHRLHIESGNHLDSLSVDSCPIRNDTSHYQFSNNPFGYPIRFLYPVL